MDFKQWRGRKPPKLDPVEARPLTSREVAKILGALLGGLVQMAEEDAVRTALRWWAEHPDALHGVTCGSRMTEDELRRYAALAIEAGKARES